jgi:leader peptidase (prepilin peptidase)/N-methyltransferase
LISFFLISVVLFILGTALGSFINVVIYRTVKGESWVLGRSKCEQCHRQLRWYDNVPLLSFVFLRGKCRFCRTPIAIDHPVVEFLTGLLFVWWYWGGMLFFQLTQRPFLVLQPLFWLVVGILLLIIFFADIRYYLIPDIAVGLLLVMTICYRLGLTIMGIMQVDDLLKAGMGVGLAVALFGGLWLITRGRGMGLGDVKFAAPMALLLGWPNIVVGVFLAFVLGAVVGVGLLMMGKKRFGQVIPFGPFLVMSTIITLVWGDALLQWYVQLL